MIEQQASHTVGDTFTVVHRVAVAPGSVVQPRPPADSSIATLMGAATVSREGDSVRIAYTVAVWAPGRNELVLPGAIVVGANGQIDTLPDARVMLDIASVLPAGQAVSTVDPRAARPWVQRNERSLLPVAVLLPIALAVVAAMHWHRRRRGPVPPHPAPIIAPLADAARLAAWLDAGEARIVADHLELALADVPAAAAWRDRLTAVRFAPVDGAGLDALCREGLELLRGAGQP